MTSDGEKAMHRITRGRECYIYQRGSYIAVAQPFSPAIDVPLIS